MKKFVILPMIAVAALGLAACKHDAPVVDNTSVTNEVTLNSEAPVDANTAAIDDAPANGAAIDNATAVDNAVVSNTAK